jgi:hypothetical protein
MAPLRLGKKVTPITMTLDGLSETIAAAADAAAEKVLEQAATARTEVERELEKFNEMRDKEIRDLSRNVTDASARADGALVEHTRIENGRFGSIESKMAEVAVSTAATTVIAAAHTVALAEIAANVKSLLETRTFTRGMVRMLALISGAVSFVTTLIFTAIHGKWWKFFGGNGG